MTFGVGGDAQNRIEEYDVAVRDMFGPTTWDLLAVSAPGFVLTARGGPAVLGEREQRATSAQLVVARAAGVLLRDARKSLVLALAVVWLIVLAHFGRVRDALLALAPLGAGMVWTLGLARLLGWQLNFMNFVILPALLGMGVDYGVHVYHRYRLEGPGSLGAVRRALRGPLFFCAATTMAGFGSMAMAHHPGLRSLGLLALVGLAACFAAAAWGLSALLDWLESRQKEPRRHPAEATGAETAIVRR
jgi:predicted RND superfamily exporter protein